jgi:prevent-host-death family protein
LADGCESSAFDPEPYSLYTFRMAEITMTKPMRKGAEEARSQLPELLTAAQHGRRTIITRHGRPVAILAPISAHAGPEAQRSLLARVDGG